jgi:hypothetical protein
VVHESIFFHEIEQALTVVLVTLSFIILLASFIILPIFSQLALASPIWPQIFAIFQQVFIVLFI